MEIYINIIMLLSGFITATVGISYALLSGSISEIESKYSSMEIVESFEFYKQKMFDGLVQSIYALLSFVFYCLIVACVKEPYPIFDIFAFLFSVLLLISVVYLLVEYFSFIKNKEIYASPTRLLNFITKEQPKSKKNGMDASSQFLIVEDLLMYALANKDEKACRECVQYIYTEFSEYREEHTKEESGVIYPEDYYKFIKRVSDYCLQNKDNNYIYVEDVIICGPLLIGELEYAKISKRSYDILWYLIKEIIKAGRKDLLMHYWERSHQFKDFTIDGKSDITDDEKNNYIEFHLFIGAYLYYNKNYDLLKDLFNYSNMTPPKYVLFPKNSTEIFKWIAKILYPEENKYAMLQANYPFTDSTDMRDVVRESVLSYLVILLCREYNLPNYLIIESHQELPYSNNASELSKWVDFVIPCIEKEIERNILEQLFESNQIEKINEFVKQIKSKLTDEYNQSLVNLQVSKSKEEEFYNEVKTSIKNNLKYYKKNESDSTSPYKRGLFLTYNLFPKMAFSDKNQSNSYPNIGSTMATMINHQFNTSYMYYLFSIEKRCYHLDAKDIFIAIDKLQIKDKSKYIILAISINLEFYRQAYGISKLTLDHSNYFYDGIKIMEYAYVSPSTTQTLCVIKEEYLPKYRFIDCDESYISEFQLKTGDENDLKIYYSVINLAKEENKMLRDKLSSYQENIEQYAFVNIYANTEFALNPNAKMVLLQSFDKLRDNQELKNNIEDVKPIEE